MFSLRPIRPVDFDEVAELIHLSTNAWYLQHHGCRAFTGRPEDCRIFCDVYEDLDPGAGLVAVHAGTQRIVGSCFVHPRETHISLGILNIHPSYFGRGIAGRFLDRIRDTAEEQNLPLRLVSSALNLDSFSLYSRAGFIPYQVFQDMLVRVPPRGLEVPEDRELPSVREAELADLIALGQLEFEVTGISREKDYCYFLENPLGLWQTLVCENGEGEIDGFLVSSDHPAASMIGPGATRTVESFEALLRAQLDRFRGREVVFLLPSDQPDVVRVGYELGARNREIHFGQVIGEAQPIEGVFLPTFLPESA